ncbi:tRNA guanosine(15) transglycosylase TgtA [Methanobacterium sp. ACI-7]|uniref:tRNA guanosine(15) transglycosylase TgtA n=1 Tax=unclassified Methanobacterium TaxID=2627676 RepID=UPI0039C2F86F
MGRIGILSTPHGRVQTPALMPVIHPGKQTIDVKKYGADIVITNSYIMYKNEELREKALKDGVHSLINFDGPIVTDSGSFQLSEYGDIDVDNCEIIEFQEKIGTDIGTSLDIPTPPYVKCERAERELEITLERAEEALEVRKNFMMNSVVQGSTFPDLRAKCAEAIGKMDFEVYPIGAVVPLLENYQYKDVVDIVMASVDKLPASKPRHLMGAGHPMVFALAVAMGCDLFDSAAYILYAQDDRFLMPDGTYKLQNLNYMPCSCEVCTKYTPNDLRSMKKDQRMKLIAAHNLYISFAEIRKIKQAIMEGNLLELVEQRCRAHPYLLDALRQLKEYVELIEEHDPAYKKSAFFYSGSESLNRPEIYRHHQKLKRLSKKDKLVLLPSFKKPYSKKIKMKMLQEYQGEDDLGILGNFYRVKKPSNQNNENVSTQFAVVDVPFGIIPLEIDEIYPLAQNEAPSLMDEDSKIFIKKIVESYIEDFNEVIISESLINKFDLDFETEKANEDISGIIFDDIEKIKYIADYQFGKGAGEALFTGDIKIEKSRKTGKIRHVYDGKDLIATIRASDGIFVLNMNGAKRLHSYLPYPKNRVVVNSDAEPFAREGKSIFAKFVIDIDINIRANEEILIVNQNDDLLAFGKSILNAREIKDFNTGQAVKTRKGDKL